jgi:dipeptidase E
MLLTSAGLQVEAMKIALDGLMNRPVARSRVAFVTTAATAQPGPHDWLITEINRVYAMGWTEFSLLELAGLPKPIALDRLARVDVLYVTAGNAYHLARTIADSDLGADLINLLHDRVYVGASAGSMMFAKDMTRRMTAVFGDDDEFYQAAGRRAVSPFNLFDWFLVPHTDPETWDPSVADRVDCPGPDRPGTPGEPAQPAPHRPRRPTDQRRDPPMTHPGRLRDQPRTDHLDGIGPPAQHDHRE